jgi:Protein of unknown function (DUF3486)
MARSKIAKLPVMVRDAIIAALDDGKSYDEITTAIQAMGADVSRSAVHRFGQQHQRVIDRLKGHREIAQAMAMDLKALADDRQGRLAIEMLQLLISRASMQAVNEDDEKSLDGKELYFLSQAMKSVQQASTIEVDREAKIRAAALKEAAHAVEAVGRERGLTAETVQAIRSRILGVKA